MAKTSETIEVSVTVESGDFAEWLTAEAWRGEMVQRLEAWMGEYGRGEVAHAFAAAQVVHEARHRGLYPRACRPADDARGGGE